MLTPPEAYAKPTHRQTAIRIVKEVPGLIGMPVFQFYDPDGAKLDADPSCSFETENEFVLYLKHQIQETSYIVSCLVQLSEHTQIRAIIFEKRHLDFHIKSEFYAIDVLHFSFDLGGMKGAASGTMSLYTRIDNGSLVMRLDQNVRGRGAGNYYGTHYPAVEVAAANHYIFAMREILRMLDLPDYLERNHLGYLYLLGFETGNDIHTDYPPHWHMIYRWPHLAGSQAPHYYLDDAGRSIKNTCYIDKIDWHCRTFYPGEWFRYLDYLGRDLCAVCIQEDGGVLVTRPNHPIYKIDPYTPSGVAVCLDQKVLGTVTVSNDSESGRYTITWTRNESAAAPHSYTEEITYDPLTGAFNESHAHQI